MGRHFVFIYNIMGIGGTGTRGIILLSILVLAAVAAYSISSRSYYNHKHPVLDKLRERLTVIDPAYAKVPLQVGDSAYTENKEVITLCLTNPDTGKYYDLNTLMYVLLHEIAHVVSKGQGHGDEFKQNFAKLLREAAAKGVYDPKIPIPQAYCHIQTS